MQHVQPDTGPPLSAHGMGTHGRSTSHWHTWCRTSVLKCTEHPNDVYTGSTRNPKKQRANPKSNKKLRETDKCAGASYIWEKNYPADKVYDFLWICLVESVRNPNHLLREPSWQTNVGTLFTGLNSRNGVPSMLQCHNRIKFQTS